MEELLGLWDLTDKDLHFNAAWLWNTTTTATVWFSGEKGSTEVTRTVSHQPENWKLCEACYASNRMDANWCIECGAATIGKLETSNKYVTDDASCYPAPKSEDLFQVSKSSEMNLTPSSTESSSRGNHCPGSGKNTLPSSSASSESPEIVHQVHDEALVKSVVPSLDLQRDKSSCRLVKSAVSSLDLQRDKSSCRSVKSAVPSLDLQRDKSSCRSVKSAVPSLDLQRDKSSCRSVKSAVPSLDLQRDKSSCRSVKSAVPSLDLQRDKSSCRSVKSAVPSLDLQRDKSSCSHRLLLLESEQRQSSLLQLPSEILLHILSFLKQSVLCKCMVVCRRFHCLAIDPSLWIIVKLKKIRNINAQMLEQVASRSPQQVSMIECHGHLQTTDIINFFRKAGQDIKSLTVELTDLGAHTSDILLLSAAQYCLNLRSISIDWISISEKVIQSCKSLEELCVKNMAISYPALKMIISRHRHRLTKLDIESTGIRDILRAFGPDTMPLVEYFSSSFNEWRNDENMISRLMETFPKLRALGIYCMSQDDDAVKEIATFPLHTLHFKIFFKSSRIYSFLNEMSTLRHLSVDSINDEGLLILCAGSLELRTLDLSGSYITNRCFRSILEGSFSLSLQTLKLNQCDGINMAALERIVQSFSSPNRVETMAQEVGSFIDSCQSLRCIELGDIHCAKELDIALYKPCVITL